MDIPRFIGILLTFLCVQAYMNVAIAAHAASFEFWTYLETHDLKVQVAAVGGFEGAVNVLLPDGMNEKTLNLMQPTQHQRWWGLVQEHLAKEPKHVGQVFGFDQSGIIFARTWLYPIQHFVYVLSVGVLIAGIFLGKSTTAIYADLQTVAINSFVSGMLVVSMYAMYWEEERQACQPVSIP